MMKAIVRYYELAHKAIEETAKRADRISYALLKQQTATQLTKLKNMKFQSPKVDRKELIEVYATLVAAISSISSSSRSRSISSKNRSPILCDNSGFCTPTTT